MTSNTFLYEEGSDLNIPLAGRFLSVDFHEDGTATVRYDEDRTLSLKGRYLKTSYQEAFDGELAKKLQWAHIPK